MKKQQFNQQIQLKMLNQESFGTFISGAIGILTTADGAHAI